MSKGDRKSNKSEERVESQRTVSKNDKYVYANFQEDMR